ncbi:22616_t:CDS:1, partial [Gigaspora rosea]
MPSGASTPNQDGRGTSNTSGTSSSDSTIQPTGPSAADLQLAASY